MGYAHFYSIFGFTWPIKIIPLIFQFTVAFLITFGKSLIQLIIPSITFGNQKWKGVIPIFIINAEEIIKLIIIGTTVGAHRYFTHRGFKANKKLRLFLIFLQTTTAQDPIINWVRDHRVHHKFTDTDADPYNAKRGFFFSHIGWLFVRKHPDVYAAGKKIDISDVTNDKVLRFQKK